MIPGKTLLYYRPGRVDLKQYIGHCSQGQCKAMFKRFYPDVLPNMATDFAAKIADLGADVSSAQLQGFFMFYKRDPSEAISNVWRLKPK